MSRSAQAVADEIASECHRAQARAKKMLGSSGVNLIFSVLKDH